jgi:hypothetical protein
MSDDYFLFIVILLSVLIGFWIGVLSTPIISITTNVESGNYTFDIGNNMKSVYDKSICNQTNMINIDKLNEQCGSTSLTKKYGSDEWQIFKSVCTYEHYCKYDYVKLSECYKG